MHAWALQFEKTKTKQKIKGQPSPQKNSQTVIVVLFIYRMKNLLKIEKQQTHEDAIKVPLFKKFAKFAKIKND